MAATGVDVVLIQISLPLLCKTVVLILSRCIYMTKAEWSVSKARSPPGSPPFKGQVTEQNKMDCFPGK